MASNDVESLYIWDPIKAANGVYYLYVEENNSPNTFIDTTTNKHITIPIKKVADNVMLQESHKDSVTSPLGPR